MRIEEFKIGNFVHMGNVIWEVWDVGARSVVLRWFLPVEIAVDAYEFETVFEEDFGECEPALDIAVAQGRR
jgi:hypothetical protein